MSKIQQTRHSKVLLKSRKERTTSSREWLLRQLNDPYVRAAKQQGYRSRAAFKLIEIHEKFSIFKGGLAVVDLGAAPGGWTQVAVELTKAYQPVLAIDILPMDPLTGAHVMLGDFTQAESTIRTMYPNGIDVLLSDMSPATCGVSQVDHLRIMGLAEDVFDMAKSYLKPGGSMIVKVLRGGTDAQLLAQVKRYFAKVHHYKPTASRQDSREIYLVAMQFRTPNAL
ncbi:MAG: RlmE family RNA methyltransferase [Alphaproteobacteria bacterium]